METKPLPARPHLEQYHQEASDLLKACSSAGTDAIHTWASALQALAQETSPAVRFEAAADAIVSGDIETVEKLLREDPQLIAASSRMDAEES